MGGEAMLKSWPSVDSHCVGLEVPNLAPRKPLIECCRRTLTRIILEAYSSNLPDIDRRNPESGWLAQAWIGHMFAARTRMPRSVKRGIRIGEP